MTIVVLVIPTLVAIVLVWDIDAWLIRKFELPALEKTPGFKTDHARLPATSGVDEPLLVITQVDKGLPFDLAGVRSGDIPRLYHGEREFLFDLVWGKHHGSVTFRLTPLEEASRGNWRVEREVTVKFPPATTRPPV